MSAIVSLAPGVIAVGKRLRPIHAGAAEAYAQSYRDGKAVPPILVRPVEGGHLLVAGGHRLAGARLAGLAAIDCEVRALNDDEAVLAEAEENLVRRSLNFLDRAVSLAAHKTAYERLHPETKNGGDRKSKFLKKQQEIRWQSLPSDQRPPEETSFRSFSEAASAALDLSPRTIRDAITLLGRIDDAVVALLQPLPVADSRMEIELLATFDAAEQRQIAQTIVEGRARSVREARAFGGFSTRPPAPSVADRGLGKFQEWISAAPSKHADLAVAYCARPIAEAFRRAGWTVVPPTGGEG